jgi:hypothetical protein
MIKNPAVPVIMYHSIGIPNNKWRWNFLTCHYKVFEGYLKWMKIMRFHSVSLQQLYTYRAEGRKLPKNPVVLTFDDGYVDNWVFAYPLLKKYGFNGTIFVNPEFVDPRNVIRKNLENVHNGEVEVDDLETLGYLSWGEMKVMEEDTMDIQSHTMTHTLYPNNNIIIDFRYPGDSYIWMTWNGNVEKKPYLQIDNEEFVNYGEPVYQHGKAIGVRRFFPDENLRVYLKDYVKEKGRGFFRSENWREKLSRIAEKYKHENRLDERIESEKEYEERIYYELGDSKRIIENRLSKEVKFLAWAAGAVTDKALKIASEVGYISSTYSSREKSARYKNLKNNLEDPSRIRRIGLGSYCKTEQRACYWNERTGIYLPPPILILKLKAIVGKREDEHEVINDMQSSYQTRC